MKNLAVSRWEFASPATPEPGNGTDSGAPQVVFVTVGARGAGTSLVFDVDRFARFAREASDMAARVMKRDHLTRRQFETLETVAGWFQKKGDNPTIIDLAESAGVGPSAMYDRLTQLRAAGMVTWARHTRRTIEPTALGRAVVASWPRGRKGGRG